MVLLAACASVDHHINYPREQPPQVITWSAEFEREGLLMHIEGARPPGKGPFPTVLVHPEEDETAEDMHGVIWDLATRGYVAIAADYKRFIDGQYRRNMFAWRSTTDLTLITWGDARLSRSIRTASARSILGGRGHQLLMAGRRAHRSSAHYPIVDFLRWYAGSSSGLGPTLFALALVAARRCRRPNDQNSRRCCAWRLRSSSPYISAPVLLIHGSEDTLAYPEESERMAESLKAEGNTNVQLIVIPGAGRLFNFYESAPAKLAWDASVEWLQTYLHPTPPAKT